MVQGSMTVAQYETKFTKLSCYASHMVGNDAKKMKKLQRGLAPYIQERVTPFMLVDYSKLYERALVIEKTKELSTFS